MTPRIVAANLVVSLRSLSRETSTMFFTIAFPVILVLVFGAIFTRPEHRHFDLPVQDLDQSAASMELVAHLSEDGLFEPRPVPVDVDALEYARTHKLNLLLVIPRGFGEIQRLRLSGKDPNAAVPLTYVYDPSSTSVDTKLHVLTTIIAAVNQGMTGAPPFLTMTEQSILDTKYRFIDFFVPGIIAMAVMTSTLSGALNANAELRQKGILRKLAATPITRTDWMLSNIFYQLILATLSTASILLVAYAVFDVRLHLSWWIPLYIVLEVFVFVGFGMMLTPIAREAQSAVATANAFVFPMMFLSGTFFPVEMMPPFLQNVARLLPLYYVNEGLRASMIFGNNMAALSSAAITASVAVAVFAIGAIVTRWDRGI